jgi:hypothetical protein
MSPSSAEGTFPSSNIVPPFSDPSVGWRKNDYLYPFLIIPGQGFPAPAQAVAVGAVFGILPDCTPLWVRLLGYAAAGYVITWATRQLVTASRLKREREGIRDRFQALINRGYAAFDRMRALDATHGAAKAGELYKQYEEECRSWIEATFGREEAESFRVAHDFGMAAREVRGGYTHLSVVALIKWLENARTRFWQGELIPRGRVTQSLESRTKAASHEPDGQPR